MRMLINGIVPNNSAISATNSSISYPARNIYHPYLRKRFQSANNLSVIIIEFDSDQTANCVFIGNHNISNLNLVFRNQTDTIIYSQLFMGPLEPPFQLDDTFVHYFDTLTTIRKIEFQCEASAGGLLIVGGAECGIYYQAPNFLNGYPLGLTDNSRLRKSRGGQSNYDIAPKLRRYSFSYRELENTDMQEQLMNRSRSIFIDITEGNRNLFAPGYFDVLSIPSLDRVARRYTTNLEIEEAR